MTASLDPVNEDLRQNLQRIAGVPLDHSESVGFGAMSMEGVFVDHGPDHRPELVAALGATTVTGLQGLYERFETDLENDYANRIIRGDAELEDYPLYERFQRLIAAEVDLAQIEATDSVLFIGSGPLPISPILLHRATGALVDCHDISPTACATSQQLIAKLDLTEAIRIMDVSGPEWAYPERQYGHDVIIVAVLAQPKEAIAWKVFQFGPKLRRVIFRDSEGNRKLFYAGMAQPAVGHERDLSLVATHHAGAGDTISSRLFKVTARRDKF